MLSSTQINLRHIYLISFLVPKERIVSLEDQQEKRSVKASSKGTKTRGKENSMTSFPPSRLSLPTAYQITQVASGLHHSGKKISKKL